MPIRAPAAFLVGAMTCVVTACGGDGRTLRDPVFDPPAAPVEVAPAPTATIAVSTQPPGTLPPEPAATAAPLADRPIEFDRLYSPANATAEVIGTGAAPGDPVTVDGEPADVISFDLTAEGFAAQIWIEAEGAHTVCVADTCGRVFTLAPDAESPAEVEAKIDEALGLAAEYVDPTTEFPGWTIEIGGPFSGTGGTTDVDTKTITIHRNRGRSVDDYVRTVLHELGHAADADRLDDAERAQYLLIRGADPKAEWFDGHSHRLDEWSRQPGEDFAEIMVMFWTDGRWSPRTLVDLPVPSEAQLADSARLADFG